MFETLILFFKSLILGVVEGITEFLPISSTGHMIIVGHFLKFEGEFANLFEIVIQSGAILAIIYLFREKIINSLKTLQPGGFGFRLWTSLALAFLPAAVIGILFYKSIKFYLMNPVTVAGALFVGGIWMIHAENKYRNNSKINEIEGVGYKEAFIIGCFQCLSVIWPGFSRSASTIIGGWIMGLSNVAAAEYSFFLSIPTLIIAGAYELLKTDIKLGLNEIFSLTVGFIVSFLVAYIVVDKFIGFLKEHPMKSFAYYRIVIGAVILGLAFFKII
jgi:undecaprenyl-diphosphatase